MFLIRLLTHQKVSPEIRVLTCIFLIYYESLTIATENVATNAGKTPAPDTSTLSRKGITDELN
jgi:hypothetical protein